MLEQIRSTENRAGRGGEERGCGYGSENRVMHVVALPQ